MKLKKLLGFLLGVFFTASHAANISMSKNGLALFKQAGFFRFSFDTLSMPHHSSKMGLVGVSYFADITPLAYAGIGSYGSLTGTQGGLFTLGIGGGIHQEFFPRVWGDMGLDIGGGGGKSSLVGGGLMIRPHVGLAYDFNGARLGVHYSYISFPDGEIHSNQIGLNLDISTDFYYLSPQKSSLSLIDRRDIQLPAGKYLDVYRNDFALLLAAYQQRPVTKDTSDNTRRSTIGIIGAEIDHYLTKEFFWSFKTGGAFSGIRNGYMDVLGGLGYHWAVTPGGLAFISQFSIGAGGGGGVDTAGGLLVHPQVGVEVPISTHLATRINGGYLWAPKGRFKNYTMTSELVYHLDIATGNSTSRYYTLCLFGTQSWRMQIMNQTYLHPQRSGSTLTSPINLIAIQLDQLISPFVFLSYQAASAYSGKYAGGLATGMIGAGIQSSELSNWPMRLFAELLVGAGGGGGLALGGGSLIEPAVGLHYTFTPALGLTTSISQVKALRNDLNTPVFNVGLTLRFDTLNQIR